MHSTCRQASKPQGQSREDAAWIILQTASCMKVPVDSAELSSWAKIVHWLRGSNAVAIVEMFGELTVPHFTWVYLRKNGRIMMSNAGKQGWRRMPHTNAALVQMICRRIFSQVLRSGVQLLKLVPGNLHVIPSGVRVLPKAIRCQKNL